MNEEIRTQLAALNAAWQRYARTAEEQLDLVTAEALDRDYRAAWEGLDACGIAEWMLEYDPTTLTFSLPTIPVSTIRNLTAGSEWDQDGPDREQGQLI